MKLPLGAFTGTEPPAKVGGGGDAAATYNQMYKMDICRVNI